HRMSCNEKASNSKNKHYTLMERKVFLQILNDYKHVIELKYTNISNSEESICSKKISRKRKETFELSGVEDKLRIERLKGVMNHDEQLTNFKLEHEKKMANIKEDHLKIMNHQQLEHLKNMHKLMELEINKAKLKIVESQSAIKENIHACDVILILFIFIFTFFIIYFYFFYCLQNLFKSYLQS
ncbi:hypothetical protein ALC62_05860, partial [Cyphomyrmex costatus]